MLKLTCNKMRNDSDRRADVTIKEQGVFNDIVIEINGVTVAWITPKGWLEMMNLSQGAADKLRDLGFSVQRPNSCSCNQLQVKQ